MAVQQNKKSPSRRDMRRAHQKLSVSAVATDRISGDRHLRHHMTESDYYRGRRIIEPPVATEEQKAAQ